MEFSKPVPIIFIVCLPGIITFALVYLCHKYCSCACTSCLCFRHSRNRNDYNLIYESEKKSVSSDNEKSFGQDTCGICLEEMRITEALYRAPCRHKFHKKCLEQWLHEDNRCPLCNGQVQPNSASETRMHVSVMPLSDDAQLLSTSLQFHIAQWRWLWIPGVPKKGLTFDLMWVENDCTNTICFYILSSNFGLKFGIKQSKSVESSPSNGYRKLKF